MKILIFASIILLSGCAANIREKIAEEEIFQKCIHIFQLQNQLDIYQQPENTLAPITARKYKLENGDELNVILPRDYYLSTEIEARFTILKDKHLIVNDNTYWLPSKDYVISKLLPAYKKANTAIYNLKYDCDDFSRNFCSFSQSYFTETVITKPIEAIAISEIYYHKTDYRSPIIIKLPLSINIITYRSYKHAINCILLEDQSTMFIEPQVGLEINLSSEEIKSIYFCKF